MNDSNKKYFFYAILSYVIWGFIPIMFRILGTEYNYFLVIRDRMLYAAIFLNIYIIINNKTFFPEFRRFKEHHEKLKTILLTLTGAICLVANWVTYLYVLNNISINAGSFAYFILPILTALLAYFILGETLQKLKLIGIGLSLISCILMANIGFIELFYVLIIALSYSMYLISQRRNSFFSRALSLAMQLVIGSFLFYLISPILPLETGAKHDIHYYLIVCLIALFFTVLPTLLNLIALTHMESGQVAFLIYINPIIGFLTGIIIYGEKISALSILAYMLLVVGIILFNWELINKISRKFGLKRA